ncbi:hypothetical protein LC607_34690 [Nostoc sp. CHAB 5824]|nr:hypothetical protein [Nostoc sp. CHAB 5824]
MQSPSLVPRILKVLSEDVVRMVDLIVDVKYRLPQPDAARVEALLYAAKVDSGIERLSKILRTDSQAASRIDMDAAIERWRIAVRKIFDELPSDLIKKAKRARLARDRKLENRLKTIRADEIVAWRLERFANRHGISVSDAICKLLDENERSILENNGTQLRKTA